MNPRRAIVLAAGRGSRLGPLGADRPAAMLEVAGRTLIERQLDALADCGVRTVCIVVGHHEQSLREHVGSRATFICSPDFANTASLHSLWLAAAHVQAGAWILKANLLFAPMLLHQLLASEYPDALLLDSRRPSGLDEVTVQLAGPFVVDLGQDLPLDRAAGTCVGIAKVGPEGGRRLVKVLTRMVGEGASPVSAAGAVAELARSWPVMGVDTGGLPWTAVEVPADLERATRAVAPAIDKLASEQRIGMRR